MYLLYSTEADCSLTKEIGPCRGAKQRFFYNTESGACEAFLYGGCEGNANNFETAEECTSRCGGEKAGSDEDEREYELGYIKCPDVFKSSVSCFILFL